MPDASKSDTEESEVSFQVTGEHHFNFIFKQQELGRVQCNICKLHCAAK